MLLTNLEAAAERATAQQRQGHPSPEFRTSGCVEWAILLVVLSKLLTFRILDRSLEVETAGIGDSRTPPHPKTIPTQLTGTPDQAGQANRNSGCC